MNRQQPSTAAAPRATDAEQLDAFKNLENTVCELVLMAGIVSDYFEGCRVDADGDSRTIRLTNTELEKLTFGIYDVESRANRLKDQYLAAFAAKAVAS